MTTLQTTVLVGGAIIALTAFQKFRSAGSLNFYPGSLKNIYLDGITPVATFGLVIQNPSSQSFTVKSLAGNLTANGFQIGNVSSYLPIEILANSQRTYNLTVRLSILGVVNDIISAFNGNGATQTIEFKAWANVDNLSVPITLKYKVP